MNEMKEKQKEWPYSKFLEFKVDEYGIPEELKDRIHPDRPMNPENILKITDIDLLLDADYQAEDEGYCVCPDGTGYVGEKFFYPGATKDMFEWWFAWHGLEDTRYRIWDPKGHCGASVSGRHMKRRTDPALNWKERNWGTSDFVTAYTVDGVSTVRISFFSPEDFGFSPEALSKSDASVVCAVSGKPDMMIGDGPSIRVLHQTEEGLHVWTYFWYGYTILNKKAVRLGGFQCDPEVPKLQVTHCAEEYTRLGKILPFIYQENHGIADLAENFETMPF